MKSIIIIVAYYVIAVAIKLNNVQGLQCYVCDDCNEYEDLKELQMCGDLPVITTVISGNAPETVATNPTATLTVPLTTQKPIGPNDGDDYFYDNGMVSNGAAGATDSNQQGKPNVTEVTVVGTTIATTINPQLGNGDPTIIGSTIQPVLVGNVPTMMPTGNITNNVVPTDVNGNPTNIASTLQPVLAGNVPTWLPSGSITNNVVPGVVNGNPIQPVAAGNVPTMLPSGNIVTNSVPGVVNGDPTNNGSTLQPVLAGNVPTMLPSGSIVTNSVPAVVNGNPTNNGNVPTMLPSGSIVTNSVPAIVNGNPTNNGNVPTMLPSGNIVTNSVPAAVNGNPTNNGNVPTMLPSGNTVINSVPAVVNGNPTNNGNVPTMLPSGNIVTNSVPAAVNGNPTNIESTLQPLFTGNVANTGPAGNTVPIGLPPGNTVTNSVPSAVTALKPVQQPVDYDYLDYEDTNAGGAIRLLRAVGNAPQSIVNRPVCYMYKYHANNTVYTKRGCTNSINDNSYLTCQSMFNGLPMSGCRICNTDGCNKNDYDESGEDPIYSAGIMLKHSLFLISLFPIVASILVYY